MTADLVRVVVSLGVVLGLLWLGARVLRRTSVVRGTAAVEVLARAQLARNSSLAVVRVADRGLVLGVGDGRVSLLAEVDVETVRTASTAPARQTREPVALERLTAVPISPHDEAAAPPGAASGRLSGSALSPATWRAALEAIRARTVRRA